MTDTVKSLADRVMRGVVSTGVMNDASERKLDGAVRIMRAELTAFLFDARYADARDCLMRRSMSEAYVVGLIVAECAAQIGELQ